MLAYHQSNKAWKVPEKRRLEVLNRYVIGAFWRKRKKRCRGDLLGTVTPQSLMSRLPL